MQSRLRHHAINIGLTALSSAYAAWLRDHKSAEPDLTFAEVMAGVGYTLAGAHLHNRLTRGTWRDAEAHVLEAFCYSAPPIIIGELWQAYEAYRTRARFQQRQDEDMAATIREIKYEDLLQ